MYIKAVAMVVIPAIDIKQGRCVRLVRGEEGTETVFSNDPVAVARKWEKCGAELIHLVDLDGAFRGEPANPDLIADIAAAVSCPVQAGGGIRSLDAVRMYISKGVQTVIVGTAALESEGFLEAACSDFPGRIAVALDTRGDKVAVRGWTEDSAVPVKRAVSMLEDSGVSLVIRTDIERDGTMSGVDLKLLGDFLAICGIPVVTSGGVSCPQDIEELLNFRKDGLHGVIVGRAIYSGGIDLENVIRRFS